MIPVTIACGPAPGELVFLLIFIIFIPTIIIEAILLKFILKKKWGQSLLFSSIANVASSIAGIIFTIIFMSTANSLYGIDNTVSIICSALILAILISVEYAIYQISWKDIQKKKLMYAVIRINVITYGTIFIIGSILPAHGVAREPARRISCTSNLKQIGLSLKQYAMDYNDFFPNKGLEQLRTNDYLTDYGVYNCPSTVTRKGKDNEKLTNEILDYIYRKGLKDSEDSNTSKIPIAWDKPENHKYYGNVLFVDGHVKGFKGTDWMEQAGIKKAKK